MEKREVVSETKIQSELVNRFDNEWNSLLLFYYFYDYLKIFDWLILVFT